MNDLNRFLHDKIMDCEFVFENANTSIGDAFIEGMLKHGGELNVVLMNIGKRQAYMDVLDYLRSGGM